jgi:hypothetical protein
MACGEIICAFLFVRGHVGNLLMEFSIKNLYLVLVVITIFALKFIGHEFVLIFI